MRTLSINTDLDEAGSCVVIDSAAVYVVLISTVTASQDFVDYVCVVLPSGALYALLPLMVTLFILQWWLSCNNYSHYALTLWSCKFEGHWKWVPHQLQHIALSPSFFAVTTEYFQYNIHISLKVIGSDRILYVLMSEVNRLNLWGTMSLCPSCRWKDTLWNSIIDTDLEWKTHFVAAVISREFPREDMGGNDFSCAELKRIRSLGYEISDKLCHPQILNVPFIVSGADPEVH